MSDEYETDVAVYEAERNRAWHSWFAARGDVSPSDEHTRIFDGGFRMAWELCRAQPAPEPVAWMCGDSATACEAVRDDWARQGFEVRPLYAAPPTDSAALRDAAIAELVRRKMTSGNGVPVERCIITAAEIAAIAQQEAP